ncbi:outer membrane beta-barrel protein [bacterium]|nr:outer membrane beta-barrel protein [bacterium]
MKRIYNLGFLLFLATGFVYQAGAVDVTVGGYVDAQFNAGWSKDISTSATSGGATFYTKEDADYQTFRFNQGAIRLSSQVGSSSVMVDIDLFGPAITKSTGFSTSTTNQAISIGETQSQAFVATKYENGFDWMLGQFDSRYGFEGNDTDTIRFSAHGILWDLMPVTHVGAVLGYGFSDQLRFEILVGNAYNQGHLKEGNVDMGAKVYTEMGGYSFNLGFLGSTGDHDQAGFEKEFGYLVDLDIGMEVAGHDFAIYGAYKKPDHKDSIKDWGFGADFGYGPDVGMGYGMRVEYASISDDKVWEMTVGPQYRFNSDFVTKFDYSYKTTNFADAIKDDQLDHSLNLAAVYTF